MGPGERLSVTPARRIAIGRNRGQVANQRIGQQAWIAANHRGVAEYSGPEFFNRITFTIGGL